jgi:Family of unknown function (DUF6567)
MRKAVVMIAVPLLLNGCAAVSTLPVSSLLPSAASSVELHNQTTIKLEQANFRVIKTNVVGRCKGFALVGLITLSPAKFSKAMDRLYAQAEMESGKPQTLANVAMERSSSFFVLFSIPQVSVRGDVVEFLVRPEAETSPRRAGDADDVGEPSPDKEE